ncbi:hypothetical protein QBC34DRAFT_394672 [Podospora aff. communis PSN243]|uniref:MARVEL domain-containing protein n=1 Tax=Podospora aff. communis PSN243 TaxID=3040156 RepID=A0AAV9GZI5_9PEZI|nr:hypothetical protein QBC34DRAFT_394672 [Podospora aff. communis PSN243]
MAFEDLELNAEHVPKFKLAFHIGQIVFALVLWCMEIAVFRAEGSIVTGNVGWTFAVCFLTIPAWVYLAMAPRFPRTRKLANPYAMACVDGLFALIWLSAFSTQAAYNTANHCGTACGISKACVAMGVFVCLLFCVTTVLSVYTVKYYQWHNRLPGYDKLALNSQNIDPDKAAFSTAPHDEEAYAPVHMDDHDNDATRPAHSDYSDPYGAPSHISDPYTGAAGVSGSQVSYGAPQNPFQQQNPFDDDTEYRRPSPGPPAASGRYNPPTAHDEDDDTRPVTFPSANYDRITR